MPDLQFQTRVNLSGLQSGMAQASATVVSSSEKMAAALNTQKIAAAQLSDAYKQLGGAVASGSQQAAAVLADYVIANDAAKAAVQDLRQAVSTTTPAIQQLAAAEEEENVVLRQTISTRMAASAELRVLQGNIGGSTRAAAAFISTLPGVGAAMQAAFPIFGAIALIEVLGQAVGAVNRLIDAFHNLSGAETDAASKAILAGDKIVNIKPEKLSTDAAARFIAGIPANGPVEVQQAAAALKQIEYKRQLADIAAQNNEAGLKGKALDEQKIIDLGKQAQFARDAATQAQILIDTYQKQLKAEVPFYQLYPGRDPDAGNQHLRKISDPNQIKEIQSQMRSAQQAKEQFEQDARVSEAKVPGVQNKEDRTDEAKTQLQQIQDRFAELNQAKSQIVGHPLTAGEASSFWAQYLSTFKAKTNEARTILEEFTKAQSEQHKQIQEAYKKTQEPISNEAAERGMAALQKELAKETEDVMRNGDRWREYNAELAKETEIQFQVANAVAQASIAQEEALGGITKVSASYQTAALHAQEYAEKLRVLKKQLDEINADPALSAVEKATQGQAVKNQITQTQSQAQAVSVTDSTKTTQAVAAPYMTAFQTINNGFLQVQQKMILGTRNITRDFAEMGAQLVVSTAQHFEQMLAKSIQFEIAQMAAHRASQAANLTVDAAGAAAHTQLERTSALKDVFIQAKDAAAKAFNWASSWGGPVAGAVAAGITFPAVMALAAFETGGIIPNTGVAMVHQGEAVLPASLTSMLLRQSSSSTNSNSANMTVHNHGMSDRAFREAATRNAEHMLKTVNRGARRLGMVSS